MRSEVKAVITTVINGRLQYVSGFTKVAHGTGLIPHYTTDVSRAWLTVTGRAAEVVIPYIVPEGMRSFKVCKVRVRYGRQFHPEVFITNKIKAHALQQNISQ
jgi:hypothetical protein